MDHKRRWKMISVVSLRYHPAQGGVETRAQEVTSRLAGSFDLKMITSDLKMERPYEKLTETERISEYRNVPITRLGSKKFLPVEGYGVVMKGLKDAVKGSELIHTHTYGAHHTDSLVKIANKMKVPSLITTHLHPSTHSQHKMLRSIYDSIIGKKTFKRANHIITITEIEKNYIAQRFGVPKSKMTAIPNGIDLETFRDLGYERDENSLLFVGRLSPVKRLDLLFDALPLVKKTIPDIKLKIIGRDWGVKSKLIETAKELKISNNIEFLGGMPFDKLIEHYNRAKVFVLTSKYEAFGITIMEAIGCGTPVVVTSVGGVPEVVGDSGILCKENAESVAKGILEVLTNSEKYDDLKKKTQIRRKGFSWDDIAKRVKVVYEEILNSKSPGGS
jgi:glycosyltransferase involved in cell wall biosynthesis